MYRAVILFVAVRLDRVYEVYTFDGGDRRTGPVCALQTKALDSGFGIWESTERKNWENLFAL